MYQITLSEFPENLRMLVSQAQLTGDSLEITQDGETVAVISPVTRRKRVKFGMMKSRTRVLGDIVEPTSDLVDWDVLS
jgi:antitoxin (DNA-binding transcriptional repressor) of toxin-antitoxin stability system